MTPRSFLHVAPLCAFAAAAWSATQDNSARLADISAKIVKAESLKSAILADPDSYDDVAETLKVLENTLVKLRAQREALQAERAPSTPPRSRPASPPAPAPDPLDAEVHRLSKLPPSQPVRAKFTEAAAFKRPSVLRLLASVLPQLRAGEGEVSLTAVLDILRADEKSVSPSMEEALKARGAIRFKDGSGINEGTKLKLELRDFDGNPRQLYIGPELTGRVVAVDEGFDVRDIKGLQLKYAFWFDIKSISFRHDQVVVGSVATVKFDLTKERPKK